MNGILSYGIDTTWSGQYGKKKLLITLLFFFLVSCLPAQDSLCPPVQKTGAELNRELQDLQRSVVRYLQENRGWIEIQRDFGSYVLNKSFPVSVSGDKYRMELVFLLDVKKQTTDTLFVPWESVRDEQLRVLNSTTNIQTGSSRQEYRVKLGSCLFSVKDNPAPVRLLRDQLLQYQQRYLEYWSGIDSFAYKLCQFRKSAEKGLAPEDQHRYMIQAQTCTRLGRYHNAMLLLEKATGISPFTSPENYLNLAIMYAENNRYHSALFAIRKYLLLAEDPADKKLAEQKMTEWEIIIKN